MQRLVVFGGSGHARVIIDAAKSAKLFDVIGILDLQRKAGELVDGVAVLGPDEILDWLCSQHSGLKGVIGIGDNQMRESVAKRAMSRVPGFSFASVIHPAATVASNVKIGAGAFLAAGVTVNLGSTIGVHAVINTNASVDHDCVVGDFAFVAPGVALAGAVAIGRSAFVGTGASVIPGKIVGDAAVVGAGSAVIRDVAPGVTVVGVPARPVRRPG